VLIVSESTETKFSLSILESIGTLCVNESTCHLWKHCRWWFLIRKLLNFRWRFLSQQLCARTNTGFNWEAVSVMLFESAATQFSPAISESTGDLCATSNPSIGYGVSLVDYFWVVSHLVFGDNFKSHEQLIFRWWFPSQVGLCALTNPNIIWESIVIDCFWVGSYSIFDDDFQVNSVCADESKLQLEMQSLVHAF
jgi:hypothetical protein